MLHCIRAIWTLCAYYSDPEKLVELLRQIAGQVIACCTVAIPVSDLLNGDVTAGLVVLQEVSSIRAQTGPLMSCLRARSLKYDSRWR